MSENQEAAAQATAPDTDGVVEARWTVAVIPNENVSIHYTVAPVKAEDAITSVTASFVLLKDHIVRNTFGGATTQDLIAPRAGQGSTGDVGVDSAVFGKDPDGQLAAILSGTVRQGEDTVNFFFHRPFDPGI